MSALIMKAIWLNGPKYPMGRFVLLAIADFANNRGKAWPSVKTLAKRCSVNETTIRRNLRHLEREGWLETTSEVGRHKTNRYQISQKVLARAGIDEFYGGHSASQPVTRSARKKSFSKLLEELCNG